MIIFFGAVFFISLVGIIVLFVLKAWEEKSGHVLAPQLRQSADREALRLRDLALAARSDASNLPQHAAYIGRLAASRAMLGFASIAQQASRQAHLLADLVSHKHNFERRQTRSEFLKKVSEFKSGAEPEGERTSEE